MAHALDRHLALVGFMGAGKSTLGAQVAERLGRRFVDLDRELERSLRQTIPQVFGERGEAEFRELEAEAALETLAGERAGRGRARRRRGRDRVDPARAPRARADRSRRGRPGDRLDAGRRGRPAARAGGGELPRAARAPLAALRGGRADAVARDVDGIVLAAAGIEVEEGLLARLSELVDGEVEVIADATVLGLHRPPLEAPVHALRGGEEAKSLGAVERLWRELRLGRDGTIVAFGGGCTTDAAGFAAATYLRGVPLGRRADDARRPGRRGDRRQDRGQPARGQEPRRRLPLAASERRSTRRCSRRCPRASVAPGWPRS